VYVDVLRGIALVGNLDFGNSRGRRGRARGRELVDGGKVGMGVEDGASCVLEISCLERVIELFSFEVVEGFAQRHELLGGDFIVLINSFEDDFMSANYS
jgi:hypothetical protein